MADKNKPGAPAGARDLSKIQPIGAERRSAAILGTPVAASELKKRFGPQKVPLAGDFAQLIDMAEHGRLAVGAGPEGPGVGDGLKLESAGQLAVNAGHGLVSDSTGVKVMASPNKGIVVDSTGVSVLANADKGISVASTGVEVKVNAAKGVVVEAEGVGVKAGLGISVSAADGVRVKAKDKAGLVVDANGVSVKTGAGIAIDSTGALTATLSAKDLFAPGMIMMFSGASVPAGWLICDGTNGTPNLKDRFILGGSLADAGRSGGTAPTGSNTLKTYSISVPSTTVTGVVDIGYTSLQISHLPAHTHGTGVPFHEFVHLPNGKQGSYGTITTNGVVSGTEKNREGLKTKTDSVGSGDGHNHTATPRDFKTAATTAQVSPAYYILAFIMKT